jgi:mevalonate kinase
MIRTFSSPGKVILCGEHSVVYGHQAVVSSLNLTITTQLHTTPQTIPYSDFFTKIVDIFLDHFKREKIDLFPSISGDLPLGVGLGGSAAAAHSIFLSLAAHFDLTISTDEMIGLIQKSEALAHGTPSGIDATAVVVGGLLTFQKNPTISYQRINTTALKDISFLLIDSGKPAENTKTMVEGVRQKLDKNPATKHTIDAVGALCSQVIEELQQNHFDPTHLQHNHQLLCELGVVSDNAQAMISEVEKIGGVAKITGAGGKTAGSGMLLAYHPDISILSELATTQAWPYQKITLGNHS